MQKHQRVVINVDRNIETIVDRLQQGQKADLTSPFYDGTAITTFEPGAGKGALDFTASNPCLSG